MRLDGEIDKADLDRAKKIAERASEKVDECRLGLATYDTMREKLSSAFANIGHEIVKGLEDGADQQRAIKTHHFLSMLFPQGLCLVPQTDTFRIKEFNRVLCGTGLISVSYKGIEEWPPTETVEGHEANPAKGGRPVAIRTLADHKALVDQYLKKFA
jgi:hypothetical protein